MAATLLDGIRTEALLVHVRKVTVLSGRIPVQMEKGEASEASFPF